MWEENKFRELTVESHEIVTDECSEEYFYVKFKVKNNIDQVLKYENLEIRVLDQEDVVIEDFSSGSQSYSPTKLKPGQACIQRNMFEWSDNIKYIEIDGFLYEDENGEYVEVELEDEEKYVVEVKER